MIKFINKILCKFGYELYKKNRVILTHDAFCHPEGLRIVNKYLNELAGKVMIPVKPPEDLLYSMAMRYNHAFGLSANMTDEEINKIKENFPIFGKMYLTSREREVILGQMAQLHEEVVGKGFFNYKS